MIPIPSFLIAVTKTLALFLDILDNENDNVVHVETNWFIMLRFINIIISLCNVITAYISLKMEPDFLDAHKIITFLLGYRYELW